MRNVAMGEQLGESRGIVVGVDGSDSSRLALKWAAEEARLRGLPLEVVITWEFPNTFGWGYPDIDLAADAKTVLEETVGAVLGDHAGLQLTTEVVQGHAAVELVNRSSNAELVVVGSRGHGGFTGLLLGSVGSHLAAHAHCPVLIIHAPPEAH